MKWDGEAGQWWSDRVEEEETAGDGGMRAKLEVKRDQTGENERWLERVEHLKILLPNEPCRPNTGVICLPACLIRSAVYCLQTVSFRQNRWSSVWNVFIV